jgi:hypothetical protein
MGRYGSWRTSLCSRLLGHQLVERPQHGQERLQQDRYQSHPVGIVPKASCFVWIPRSDLWASNYPAEEPSLNDLDDGYMVWTDHDPESKLDRLWTSRVWGYGFIIDVPCPRAGIDVYDWQVRRMDLVMKPVA